MRLERAMSKLVIVESPAKVDTLRGFLPDGYEVDSSVGHVRDLPEGTGQLPDRYEDEDWADLAVDVEDGFDPVYVVDPAKRDVIDRIERKLDDAEALYLATDEDREGEAISWHLVEVLQPDVPVRRMVFNEITQDAIEHALENPRDLDMDLVEAQEARRILDRLFGYTVSPLLWRKISSGLSAGRVQSPAVRLVVERERERRSFTSAEYWDLAARLARSGERFSATLHELDGTRVATGADFDRDTGELEDGSDVVVVDEAMARRLTERLEPAPWRVADVTERDRQSTPPAPFRTSTLQQAASSRLDMSPGHTMSVAQDLYEDGLITYMRTDSTFLSQEGLEGARKAIRDEWSDELVPSNPRTYDEEDPDEAQEAHEAIRPAGGTFTPPDDTRLTGRHKQLYGLIYRRTLASQMPNERYTSTTVLVDAEPDTVEGEPDVARFKATGKQVAFHGYRLAWPTQGDGPETLPELTAGDAVDLGALEAKGHETQPPHRYTEASLVDALEEEGIGRPSTYDSIISKIQDKDYVKKQGRSLVPTLTAFAVTTFLERHFPDLVDYDFTAEMEDTLDRIATGETESRPYLEAFFLGDEGLQARVDRKQDAVEGAQAREIRFEDVDHLVKVGRYGPYVEHETEDGEVVRANLPDDLTPDEITADLLDRLIEQELEGPTPIGEHPDTGEPIYVLTGRYGPYVQLGDGDDPDRASLPDGMSVDEATLDDALWLLGLPEALGEHPDGGEVLRGIGRYGPYVCHDPPGDDDRDYKNVSEWERLREISLDEAVQAIEKAKKGKKQGVIREMGEHPETGDEIELRGGRYGPYFKHQGDNKSLPDEMDVDEATREDAVFLVDLPETLGDHPDEGNVLKDLGRYGPYVAHEDADGDRTYVSLADYEDLRQADLEDGLFLLDLPTEIGPHPKGGTIRIDSDRDGAYLEHEAEDGETLKTVRGLRASKLRKMELDDALAHL